MLMTLGLTADVAAAHRNEASSSNSDPPTRSSFWPSSFRTVERPSTEQDPRRPRLSMASTAPELSVSDTLVTSPGSELDAYSDSAYSRTNSVTSSSRQEGSESKRRHKRLQTSYRLAHPPPTVIHKQRLRIKPKLLLQLQRLSTSVRPTPTLDVLPASVCSPRFARKWPRFFPNKIGLGTNDLVVVGSEEYHTSPLAEDSAVGKADGEGEDARPMVATICQTRKEDGEPFDKADIRFSDGPTWQATSLMTGGFEFSAMDEHGLKHTVRWVRRRYTKNQMPSLANKGQAEGPRKFGFSIIDPCSRRHPILATMTPASIDIFEEPLHQTSPTNDDSYSSSGRLSPQMANGRSSYFDSVESSKRPPLLESDDRLRNLIMVSGIWVAFREGWSGDFRRGQDRLSALPTSAGAMRTNSGRGTSLPYHSRSWGRSNSVDNRDQVGNLQVAGASIASPSAVPKILDTTTSTTPKRANSTGTVFMRKARKADKLLQNQADALPSIQLEETPSFEGDTERSSQGRQSNDIDQADPIPVVAATSGSRRERRKSRGSVSYAAKEKTGKEATVIEASSGRDGDAAPSGNHRGIDQGAAKWKRVSGLMGLFQKH